MRCATDQITKMNPSIDFAFHQKCNMFLDKIRSDLTQINDDVFISELKIISENSIEYRRKIV